MTLSGTLTINSTSITFGLGAAAAMRTAMGVANVSTKTRTADAGAVTSTTLAADASLTTALEANTTYKIDFFLHMTQTGFSTIRYDYTGTLDAATAINDIAGYGTNNAYTLAWVSVSPPQLTFFSNNQGGSPYRSTGTIQLRTATAGDFRLLYSAGNGSGGGSAGSIVSKFNQYIIATKLS